MMHEKTTFFAMCGLFAAVSGLTVLAQDARPDQRDRSGKRAERIRPADRADRAARREARSRQNAVSQEFRLAVMTYTFNRFSLFEAIEKSKQAGAEYVETYGWQKVSPEHGDLKFEPTLPEAVRQDVKKKLESTGVKLTGYYFGDLNNEPVARQVFAFCKDMGIQYIVSEPDAKSLPMLDKLAAEHEVKLAVHNHPRNPNKPEYTYWDPEQVMKALEGCSSWIGCCADNGHWVRSGLDSVESIRKYHGRLISLHLKDVNKVGADAHDVPYGAGVVPVKDLLATIKRMGFSGVFAIEYEHNMENNQADVAQCIEYFNKAKAELEVK